MAEGGSDFSSNEPGRLQVSLVGSFGTRMKYPSHRGLQEPPGNSAEPLDNPPGPMFMPQPNTCHPWFTLLMVSRF